MAVAVTAEPTTNIAEDHGDVPQAANLIEDALETELDRTCHGDQAWQIDVTCQVSVKVGAIASVAKSHTCASGAG